MASGTMRRGDLVEDERGLQAFEEVGVATLVDALERCLDAGAAQASLCERARERVPGHEAFGAERGEDAGVQRARGPLGQATLVVELRDSQSGEILARTIDRRTCIEAAPGPTELARCAER